MKDESIKKVVREGYARIARQDDSCCSPAGSCCSQPSQVEDISQKMGYSSEEIASVPQGANLGLGCGNPVALASLKEGETVLDLGCGAGFDAFLAANRVGKEGRVIGVDITAEMLEKARANAEKGGYNNVEFRLGEIENLPVVESSVDVIISNCVINLSPDKRSVFAESFRVLKPGGRLIVSDIVLLKELPGFIKESAAAYIGCVSGAMLKNDYLATIRGAGFDNVVITDQTAFPVEYITADPLTEEITRKIGATQEDVRRFADSVVSVKVQAEKA